MIVYGGSESGPTCETLCLPHASGSAPHWAEPFPPAAPSLFHFPKECFPLPGQSHVLRRSVNWLLYPSPVWSVVGASRPPSGSFKFALVRMSATLI